MKILHTADWHLGHNFYGYDRTVEYQHFLEWLLSILRQELPDVLIISGDIYDSANPSAVAEKLFYDFLLTATEAVCGLQIVAIAGNHDAAGRLDAPADLLKRHNIYVRGRISYQEDSDKIDFENLILPLGNRLTQEAEVVCLALPYLRPSDYPLGMNLSEGLSYYFDNMKRALGKSDFKGLPVVAAAHFYAQGALASEEDRSERLSVGGQNCASPDVVGPGICYVALGHLHHQQKVECGQTKMYYAGSVLPMSFEKRSDLHGVQMVTIGHDGDVGVERICYSPLRRLLTIPFQGAATATEVFEAIEELPKRGKKETDESWPYLEIRLSESHPSPTLMREVTEALADKAVHFCRMVRDLPELSSDGPSVEQMKTLQSLTPLEMAQRVFLQRFKEEMPRDLQERFEEAENRVKL